jgi:hypothetical protein
MSDEVTRLKKPYERPVLKRYRAPQGVVREYQTATGSTNSIKCTDPDTCSGGEGFAAPPPWLIP